MLNERQAVTLFSSAAAITFAAAQPANACGGPPPEPPPRYWVETHGDTDGDGLVEVWVGIEIDVFAPSGPTTCSCGIGIGTAATPIQPSASVGNAFIGITNTMTHETTPLPNFNFSPNGNATDGYQSGPGAPDGSTWFGFAAPVDPFTPPPLAPGEVYKLWFEIEVAPVDLEALMLNTGCVGSGEGNADGSPNFGTTHGGQYFAPDDKHLPTPGAAVVLAGGLTLLSRRGRTLR